MKTTDPRRYSVPALEKGLDILEALSQADVPQTIGSLALKLDRTRSEIFRMLDALEKRSYIARDPISGGYALTLKLYEVAHTHSPVDKLLRVALIPMRELAETIRESCHLSILNDGMLVVIAEAESPEPVRLSVEVGYRASPLNTVSGRLLAAFMQDEELEHFLRTDSYYTRMKPTQRRAIAAEREQIRKCGYHLAPSSRRTGTDVSSLVGNPRIGVLAALGIPFIGGGQNEGKERKLIPLIQKYANQITDALGLSRQPD
jgi:DNA-binding IclR family transcriptional regulator